MIKNLNKKHDYIIVFFNNYKNKSHNIIMIYLGSLISGILNGLFASGAGQILVCFLIYMLKFETHKARATSLICMSLATIVTFIRYIKIIKIDYINIIIIVIFGIIFGLLGTKTMNKIESNKLNLISGIIITFFSIYSLVWG